MRSEVKSEMKSEAKSEMGRRAHAKGYQLEEIVASMLVLKGYKILARNFKDYRAGGGGEVDIIALCSKTLVFVEVKQRKTAEISGYAITPKNRERVAKTAEFFLAFHPEYCDYEVRFDAVIAGAAGVPIHIEDAWRVEN